MKDKRPPQGGGRTICLGYVCECGEKVVVLKQREGTGMNLARHIPCECSNGHKRVIDMANNADLSSLQEWADPLESREQ